MIVPVTLLVLGGLVGTLTGVTPPCDLADPQEHGSPVDRGQF